MNENPNAGAASGATPPATPIIFACSGSADVGEIADRAARLLSRERAGRLACLTAVSAQQERLDVLAAAPALLVFNGCQKDCASKTLALAGFTRVHAVRVTDLGFTKGATEVTDESIRRVADRAKQILGR